MNPSDLVPGVHNAEEQLQSLVADVERHASYASALLTRHDGLRVTVDDRERSVTEEPPSQGLVLSAWNGAYFEEAAGSELTQDGMALLGRRLADSIHRAAKGTVLDPGAPMRQHFSMPCEQCPASLTPAEKLERCLDLHDRARKLDARMVNVQVRYAETDERKVFVNRTTSLSQSVVRLRLNVTMVVSDGQQIKYDWLIKDGTGGLEVVRITDGDLLRLRDSSVALLSAGRIPPGMYDVVCTPDVSGVIAHEAFGHGVELDMFLKDRARSQQYLGKQIAAPLVDIIDDPSFPGGYGTYCFDDEGQLAAPTYVIQHGVFERGLSDMYSAHHLRVPRSANGRRQDFQRKVYVRMSNTFFARGHTPVSTMIEGVEHGVYLQHTSSGMEDPKGWGMQVTSHYGEEILQGRLTGRRFAPIGITGYVPDILRSVSAVGDDFQLSGGTCGKGHKEWVPVSSGGPHLKLKARLG